MSDLINKQDAIDGMDTIDSLMSGEFVGRERQVFKKALYEAKEHLLRIPSAQQWIPVSERLPEILENERCSGNVFVALKWYDGDITYEVGWYSISGAWNDDSDNCKVIAWMPLPEPYKEV